MARRFKLLALKAFKRGGLSRWAAASRWRQQQLLILCYHGVSLEDEHLWDPDLYMAPQQFAGRMQALEKAQCNVLPLREALARLYARDLPPRSVALTFDDGFYDFYARAVPVLRQHGFPATVYLTTYYSERALPVFNVACRYILWKQCGQIVPRDASFAFDLDLRDARSRDRTFQTILSFCEQHRLSGHEKQALLEQIAARIGFRFQRFVASRMLQLLTPAETSFLAASGIDFQLHTHRHRTPPDAALFRAEVEDNRERLRRYTGGEPRHFCYPSGVVQPEFFPWLRELDVVSATTCVHGLANASTRPLELPRYVDVSAATDLEFESWLSGIGALVSRTAILPALSSLRTSVFTAGLTRSLAGFHGLHRKSHGFERKSGAGS